MDAPFFIGVQIMLGRCKPNQEQKRFWDDLSSRVGCIACRSHGVIHLDYVSIHHIAGRSKRWHHWHVLPLCAGHHQDGTGNPAMKGLAVHPWKARFESQYGTQDDLFLKSIEYLLVNGGEMPEGLAQWLEER